MRRASAVLSNMIQMLNSVVQLDHVAAGGRVYSADVPERALSGSKLIHDNHPGHVQRSDFSQLTVWLSLSPSLLLTLCPPRLLDHNSITYIGSGSLAGLTALSFL